MSRFFEAMSHNKQRETSSKVYVNLDAVKLIQHSPSSHEWAVIVFADDSTIVVEESVEHLVNRLELTK